MQSKSQKKITTAADAKLCACVTCNRVKPILRHIYTDLLINVSGGMCVLYLAPLPPATAAAEAGSK